MAIARAGSSQGDSAKLWSDWIGTSSGSRSIPTSDRRLRIGVCPDMTKAIHYYPDFVSMIIGGRSIPLVLLSSGFQYPYPIDSEWSPMPVLLDNKSHGKVGEALSDSIQTGAKLSIVSSLFSIYGYAELKRQLTRIGSLRLLTPSNLRRGDYQTGNLQRMCLLGIRSYCPKGSEDVQRNVAILPFGRLPY